MNILFVCTGNMCRSPMAEALFRSLADENGPDAVAARSAGMAAMEGQPATAQAREAAARCGLDLFRHRSQPISREWVRWADLVVVMTEAHRRRLLERFPEAAGKTNRLLSFAGSADDVADPIGGDTADYVHCLERMAPALTALVAEVKAKAYRADSAETESEARQPPRP